MLESDLSAWLAALNLGLLGRLGLAAGLGGVIGIERELSGKAAGLRTNLLICVGAALLTELSIGVAVLANESNAAQGIAFRADPARIAAQIVSGVGFLGAGTILQARGSVTGLTTAATIWVVAAIGMAVGARAYVEAVGAAALVFASLTVLGRAHDALRNRRRSKRRYLCVTDADPALIEMVGDIFRAHGIRVATVSIEKTADQYQLLLNARGIAARHEGVMRTLASRAGIHKVERAR